MRTFKCDFGKGTSCRIEVTDTPPANGLSHVRTAAWTGRLTPEIAPQYLAWMHSVNKTLADEWNLGLIHVFRTAAHRAEIWLYKPGKAPEQIERSILTDRDTPL
jgi:hypothetical protein